MIPGERTCSILCVTSLALKAPAEKMAHTIETLAPWLKPDEARDMIDHIQSTPIFERTRTARHLGDNMRLLNTEREALRLWTMLPVDMTDEELARAAQGEVACEGRGKTAAELASEHGPNISLNKVTEALGSRGCPVALVETTGARLGPCPQRRRTRSVTRQYFLSRYSPSGIRTLKLREEAFMKEKRRRGERG